jgi:fructose/tagatose bisphosphate aldolase
MDSRAPQAGVEQELGTVVGHDEGVISHHSKPGLRLYPERALHYIWMAAR